MEKANTIHPAMALDDKELMVHCAYGLLRYAQELEAVQGAEALERITALRGLTQEITAFWDLDGTLFSEPAAQE